MSTTSLPSERATRALRVPGRRVAGVALTALLVPLTLSACGLFGGQSNHGSAPVELAPTDSVAPATAGGGTGSASASAAPTTAVATQVITQGGVVVTRTNVLVRSVTRTQVMTQAVTQVVTQAPVVETVTLPAVTRTVTVAVTVTRPCQTPPCV